ESTPPATVYQTLDPRPADVPTQSFLARSKYDGAPGAPGAASAAAPVTAVPAAPEAAAAAAAGMARARPVMMAAPAINVVNPRPRTIAEPPSRQIPLPRDSADKARDRNGYPGGLPTNGQNRASRRRPRASRSNRGAAVGGSAGAGKHGARQVSCA